MTVTEAKALMLEVFYENFPSLHADAMRLATERATELNGMVVDRVIDDNPSALRNFGTPRVQAALLSAQQSYAETGDETLGTILAKLVGDLTAEESRTYKEIVYRQAIECAPRVTNQQLNALSVVLIIRSLGFTVKNAPELISAFEEFFKPYFGNIPTDGFEYSYLGSSGVGTFLFGDDVYQVIRNRHRDGLYASFREDEIPAEVLITEREKYLVPDPDSPGLFRLQPDGMVDLLGKNTTEQFSSQLRGSKSARALRKFVSDRTMSVPDLKTFILDTRPDLARFLDTLESTHAFSFHPNTIGILLAQHELSIRFPEHNILDHVVFPRAEASAHTTTEAESRSQST